MREGEFRLTPSERTELRDRMRSRTLPAEDVRRARLILLLAQGKSYLAIRPVLGCNPNYISRSTSKRPFRPVGRTRPSRARNRYVREGRKSRLFQHGFLRAES